MKYDKIALFTDLDGTLLNSRRQVSDENLAALARFTAEGGLFGISTGRAPSNALDILPPLPSTHGRCFSTARKAITFRNKKPEQSKRCQKSSFFH